MNTETTWYHDITDGIHYRVDMFKHTNGRLMERWRSSNGDSWYLGVGVSQSTFLFDHVLTPCDPVPGLLDSSQE